MKYLFKVFALNFYIVSGQNDTIPEDDVYVRDGQILVQKSTRTRGANGDSLVSNIKKTFCWLNQKLLD